MAISTALATVLSSIAAISVSGVVVVDSNAIPEEAGGVRESLLYPRPDVFLDGFNLARMSQGSGGTALGDMTYTIHYRYCHVPAGHERNLATTYPGLVTNVAAIINAITSNDSITGAVELELSGLTVGLVEDPAGEPYLGADFDFYIREFQN